MRGGCPTFFQYWDLDEDLRAAERIARNLRIHAQHADILSGRDFAPDETSVPAVDSRPGSGGRWWRSVLRVGSRVALAASFLLFLTAAATAAWSTVYGDILPWRIEMPLALAGEAGLVLSLAVYVLGDSQRERAARNATARLDGQARKRHGRADRRPQWSQASDAASPHVLLAELKARIEQLSEQLRDDA